MKDPQAIRDTQRLQASQAELVERLTRVMHTDSVIEPIKGLHLARQSVPRQKLHAMLGPSFCVIAQGSKAVHVGNDCYQYDPLHYLISTLALPRMSEVLKASAKLPYLSIRLELDPQLVSSVLVEAGDALPVRKSMEVRAIDVNRLDANLLDAIVRLIRLLDESSEAPMLMPMITREIVYRLLRSDQGERLRHLMVNAGSPPVVARAIQHIRQHFDQPLRIEVLTKQLGMSASSFHYHFKAVTGLSPLQYQKQLRLQEARRLLLSEHLDATRVAHQVGYHDGAHFSREYKSVFGIPPIRDVQRLRGIGVTVET